MKTETQVAQQDVAEGDVPAMAESLQSLLSEISTRVSLADQRYTDIIEEMRCKLAALDAVAKTTRDRAEEEARREAEAKKLAEEEAKRLAEAEAEAKRAAEEKQRIEAKAEAKRLEELEAARKKTEAEAAEAVESAKAAAAAVVATRRPAYADDGVDPFDIIDHAPVRQPREPWDPESADVFTRHFEQFTRHDSDAPLLHSSPAAAEVAGPPPGDRSDRDWLDGRFNDIAARIAEIMAAQPSDLAARFDAMETRIETAMTTVSSTAATGSDTLKQIEGHIAEIDEHVDFIRKELTRLDGMEAQIRAFIEIQKGAPAKPAEEAGQVETAGEEPSGVLQLTGLLQRLMAERRSTEEHTVSMLDTLQQAMIRVLDRIEAMETVTPAQSKATALPALERHDDDHVESGATDYGLATSGASIAASEFNFLDFAEEFADADGVAPAEAAQDAGIREHQPSHQDIRREFIANAQRARDRASGQARRDPVIDSGGALTARSLADRLLRPSTKQLAVAAVALLLPLNVFFLYLVIATGQPDDQSGMRSAAERGLLPAEQMSEASHAEASEPPISPAPELLTRINAPLPPEPETGSLGQATAPPAGTKVEMPPAAIGPLTLRRAAADGDASAQFEVAARLAEGKGIEQDFKGAVEWYLRSASTGFAQAQYRLGTHYERGLGVDRDPERARAWYQRAAEQGNVKAMHNLAVIDAGKTSYSDAVRWFTEAAAYNLPDSQFNLAVLLEGGLGGSKDVKQAYVWFALAARSGDKEAMKRRDQVKALLSADAVTAADEEVRSFRTKPQIPLVNDARVAGEAWKKTAAN